MERIRTKEQAEARAEVRLWRIRILPGVPDYKKDMVNRSFSFLIFKLDLPF
jgi:hypothetical protein